MKRFIADPTENLNSLNEIIPSLIDRSETKVLKEQKVVLKDFFALVEALVNSEILTSQQIFTLFAASKSCKPEIKSSEAADFAITRLTVFLDNWSKQKHVSLKLILLIEDKLSALVKGKHELGEFLALVGEKSFLGRMLIQTYCSKKFAGWLEEGNEFEWKLDSLYILLTSLKESCSNLPPQETINILKSIPILNADVEGPLQLQYLKLQNESSPNIEENYDYGEENEGGDAEISKEYFQLESEVKTSKIVTFIALEFQECLQEVLFHVKSAELTQEFLMELPKTMMHNLENPLILSDFLTKCLDHSTLHNQILALRSIFILIEKKNFDYPNYYSKLYRLLQPSSPSLSQSIFLISDKARFLRLLDLSLRSPKLPFKLICSFLKRICHVVVGWGFGMAPEDCLFLVSLVGNLVIRHPKCKRLIHRNKLLEVKRDPFLVDEEDPLETKAHRSSLWELQIIRKHHYDDSVRNYCKIFKKDLLSKQSVFKCEKFTQGDPFSSLLEDLQGLDPEKEGRYLSQHLLARHNQLIGKRVKRPTYVKEVDEAAVERKKVKYGEEFAEKEEDLFALHQ